MRPRVPAINGAVTFACKPRIMMRTKNFCGRVLKVLLVALKMKSCSTVGLTRLIVSFLARPMDHFQGQRTHPTRRKRRRVWASSSRPFSPMKVIPSVAEDLGL